MDSDSWRLVGIVALLCLNALFVAAEYALVGARPARINSIAKKGGRTAKLAAAWKANPNPYIAGIQVGITMAGIGMGWLGEQGLARMLEPLFSGIGLHLFAGIIAFLLVTFLLVVLGELVPKYLVIRSPERVLLKLVLPMNAILLLLRPFTVVLEASGYALLKPFGVDIRSAERQSIEKEELATMIQESFTAGEFGQGHARMVTKALRFSDLQADDVMIPRVDMVAIDVDAPIEEVLKALANQSHTRVVAVENGDLDEVVGILHLQDVVRLLAGKAKDLRGVVRPPVFVPPNLSLEKLVERMQEEKSQMLIIRDEHGGTAGLLTLEDIVEEIFGELDDQVEHAQPRILTWDDGRVIMRGDVRTDELADYLGIEENPLERESVSTIILEKLERMPRIGDYIETPIGVLRVINMSRQRITRVALAPALPTPEDQS